MKYAKPVLRQVKKYVRRGEEIIGEKNLRNGDHVTCI